MQAVTQDQAADAAIVKASVAQFATDYQVVVIVATQHAEVQAAGDI